MSEKTMPALTITTEVASHVLWRHDEGDAKPSDFIQTLIGMVAGGGRDELLHLVNAYADAMDIAETGDGIAFLKVITGAPTS
ncbi:hypothetical protein ACFQVD_26845 [Streptosporangium amethystogenes subsp. fukuiense]|uniref:Uncharacterized protein n=1 Tax=Streptosporangium amethystogenes subsp. fukuiense TaxID=698418 RepID=A0ABW2T6Q2_9ACTN